MNLRILAEAEEEVRASVEWYDARRQGLGVAFLDAITRALQAIEVNPHGSPKMQRRGAARDIRRYSLRKFPYKIIYENLPNETIVLAVAHHKRRPNYWARRQP